MKGMFAVGLLNSTQAATMNAHNSPSCDAWDCLAVSAETRGGPGLSEAVDIWFKAVFTCAIRSFVEMSV